MEPQPTVLLPASHKRAKLDTHNNNTNFVSQHEQKPLTADFATTSTTMPQWQWLNGQHDQQQHQQQQPGAYYDSGLDAAYLSNWPLEPHQHDATADTTTAELASMLAQTADAFNQSPTTSTNSSNNPATHSGSDASGEMSCASHVQPQQQQQQLLTHGSAGGMRTIVPNASVPNLHIYTASSVCGPVPSDIHHHHQAQVGYSQVHSGSALGFHPGTNHATTTGPPLTGHAYIGTPYTTDASVVKASPTVGNGDNCSSDGTPTVASSSYSPADSGSGSKQPLLMHAMPDTSGQQPLDAPLSVEPDDDDAGSPLHAMRKRALSSTSLLTPASGKVERPMQFYDHRPDTWHKLFDENGDEINPSYSLDVVQISGVSWSGSEQVFIHHKRNHLNVELKVYSRHPVKAMYVLSRAHPVSAAQQIVEFQLNFYGIRMETPSSTVKIRQSNRTNRRQVDLQPIRFLQQQEDKDCSNEDCVRPPLPPASENTIRLCRLHFAEATRNNNRVNGGLPNPDQKYFGLVISLDVVSADGRKHTVCARVSEKMIVRATNPHQFAQNESVAGWQPANGGSGWKAWHCSLYYPGVVAVGTTTPMHQAQLTVGGNLALTGKIIHPSDRRFKENIESYNVADALARLERIRIVSYKIRDEIADQWRMTEQHKQRVGVIAQELCEILPDAVHHDDDQDYLMVDDNRMIYETAAAVQELLRLSGQMGERIEEVEKLSSKTDTTVGKIKRLAVIKKQATESIYSGDKSDAGSHFGGDKFSLASRRGSVRYESAQLIPDSSCGEVDSGFCRYHCEQPAAFSARANRNIVAALVISLAFCLLSMGILVTLYLVEWHQRSHTSPTYQIIHSPNCNTSDPSHLVTWSPPQLMVSETDQFLWSLKSNWTEPVWPSSRQPPPTLHNCDHAESDCYSFCQCNAGGGPPTTTPTVPSNQVLELRGGAATPAPLGDQRQSGADTNDVRQPFVTTYENAPPPLEGGGRASDAYSWTANDLRIQLPDFNVTLDERYCWRQSCNVAAGDFHLFIPVSETMPLMPILLKFSVSNFRTVEYCESTVSVECPVNEHNDKLQQPSPHALMIADSLYEVPVGSFVRSRHQFRVGYATDLCSDDMASDLGKTYEQFTLIFYRTCDSGGDKHGKADEPKL